MDTARSPSEELSAKPSDELWKQLKNHVNMAPSAETCRDCCMSIIMRMLARCCIITSVKVTSSPSCKRHVTNTERNLK
jgi:hypothetical protein